jgi:23S rRNA (guanosine2251-2'-O)-methyltransferase
MRDVVLVVHNVRSAHNVGSLLRTAEGLGVAKVYLSGYTPYPTSLNDTRLPHIGKRVDAQIHKTSLGAETSIEWQQADKAKSLLQRLEKQGYALVALEQTSEAVSLDKFKPPPKVALIVGNEVGGVDPEILDICNVHLEIPMRGRKESFNVAVAAAIALYQLTQLDKN